jgi:hypothetical protein
MLEPPVVFASLVMSQNLGIEFNAQILLFSHILLPVNGANKVLQGTIIRAAINKTILLVLKRIV